MKRLLQIVGAGTALFMILAGAQEWSYFSTAWFGDGPAAARLDDADREEAVAVVREVVALTRHLYASGGDPRFAERMPAGEGVVREAMAEIDYLARNRRRQELVLHQLEVRSTEAIDADHVEVRTREFWTIRTHWLDGAGEADPARAAVLDCLYFVTRSGGEWRVDGWEVTPPATEAGPA